MSATIYEALQWCKLTPEEITGVIKKIKDGFTFSIKKLISSARGKMPPDLMILL